MGRIASHLVAVSVALSLALLAACSGGNGDLRSQTDATMEDFVEVLEGIETVEDARTAKGRLEAIAAKLNAQRARFEALPPAEKEAFEQASGRSEALQARAMAVYRALANKPEVLAELAKAMDALK